MKKQIVISTMVLAAVFSACQPKDLEPAVPAGPKMIEVRAVLGDGELATRASVAQGSTHFVWNAEDKVVAWNGTEATKDCVITNIDSDGIATFSVPEGTQWVIYPSATLEVTGNAAVWTRPVSQDLSAEGQLIGDGANPMFGKLEGNMLRFTNLCGYIEFQLKGSKTLSKLSFKSNNITSPAITGKADIDVSAATPVLSYPVLSKVSASGVNKYDYTNVKGQEIALGSTPVGVMVVVPPATYEGSELILEFTDGTAVAVISKNEITVTRNTVKKIAPIDVDALFPADPVALDEGGRSNCYMVIAGDAPQAYSFEASRITSGETFELAKTANLLWAEDKGLINNITYDANTCRVSFLYTGGGRKGNAVVALDQNLQGSGTTLLWNYQIWVTDQPEDILMDETEMPAPLLDRNVGATWAPKSVDEITNMTKEQWLETVGTYYQYGNHIPYPRVPDMKNSAATWDQYRVGVMYGFSNYCQKFAYSGSAKNTLDEMEQYPNYEYHKGTGVKYGAGNETVWTMVTLKGGPTGEGFDIWQTVNNASEKTTDYDPCPQGYVFVTATPFYQETLNNEVSDHLFEGKYAGKYNTDASGHVMYFPAAGYLGTGKYAMVGGASESGARVVYWGYYANEATDMGHIFRRCLLNKANTKFGFDNQAFSSQAHNMRCARIDTAQ